MISRQFTPFRSLGGYKNYISATVAEFCKQIYSQTVLAIHAANLVWFKNHKYLNFKYTF